MDQLVTAQSESTKRAITILDFFAIQNGYTLTTFDLRRCQELVEATKLEDITWASNLLTTGEFLAYVTQVHRGAKLPAWVPTAVGALYNPNTLTGEYPITELFENSEIRASIAALAPLPAETFPYFLKDYSERVRMNFAGRADLPKEIQATLASDVYRTVRAEIADNSDVSDEYRTLAALSL